MSAQMSFAEFHVSTQRDAGPAPGLSGALQALWWDARGDWEKAHTLAQANADASGAWVHAYLHRKEGDAGNAAYWYHRAGRPVSNESLAAEWKQIATALLADAERR